MPAPSPLSIATQSVQRLLKEETYYHKELASQQGRVEKLEKELSDPSASHGENDEYMLKQEVGFCLPPPPSPLPSFAPPPPPPCPQTQDYWRRHG